MDSERKAQLEAMLNTIEEAIVALVTNKVNSYRIGERSFTYYSINELMKMRQEILQELNATPLTIITTPFSGDATDVHLSS